MSSFQRSLAVLFAIGLNVYLGLEVDTSRIPVSYPRDGTLELSSALPGYAYEAITLYCAAFQQTLASLNRTLMEVRTPHLRSHFGLGFGLP